MREWLIAASKSERSKKRRTEKRSSDLQNNKSLIMLKKFSAGMGPGSLHVMVWIVQHTKTGHQPGTGPNLVITE